MLFVCYPKCSTCQKARRWLEDHQIPYELRDIKEAPPTQGELEAWQQASGLPLRRFFNTSGMRYRDLALKDRVPHMDDAEQRALLASDGMLVKRPLLVDGDWVLVGFREAEWAERLSVQ